MAIHIDGGPRLRSALRKAGADMKQLRNANFRAAKSVATQARFMAPKRSGKLAASIRGTASQKAGVVKAGRKSIPYANPIHWGWAKRNIRKNEFVSNAATKSEFMWVRNYEEDIDKILSDVEGRY